MQFGQQTIGLFGTSNGDADAVFEARLLIVAHENATLLKGQFQGGGVSIRCAVEAFDATKNEVGARRVRGRGRGPPAMRGRVDCARR